MPRSPDAIAQDWANRLAAAGDKIKAGVESVQVAPGQLAARQKNVYVQRVTERANTWAANTAAVSLQDWQGDMLNKGLARIGQGAQAAQGKFTQFMTRLLPYIETGRRQLPARGNLDQNIARMTSWVRHMAQFNNRG